MNKSAPAIMVSSTFYDLRQVRADLAEFIVNHLGYTPLLSELNSFPVDPDAITVENCRKRVEHDADILILIIGGRYGHIHSETSKSITNLEYLAARAKGIPIYAFIDKKVLSLIPIWKKNKMADFTEVLDDIRIFDFIEQVRSADNIWTHEFESAKDIIETLRFQLAYLMHEGLEWQRRLHSTNEKRAAELLSGKALRIAFEKPRAWEHRLFSQVLIDEVKNCNYLKRDYELGLALGASEYLYDFNEMDAWMRARLTDLSQMVEAAMRLIDNALQDAFGPPGKSGDVEAIVFVGRRLGEIYRRALEWTQQIRRVSTDERFMEVLKEFSQFARYIIEDLELLGPQILSRVEEFLTTHKEIQIEVKLRIFNLERFKEALERLKTQMG